MIVIRKVKRIRWKMRIKIGRGKMKEVVRKCERKEGKWRDL